MHPASDYAQRWANGRHTWRHPSDGGFDPARFAVTPLDEPTAKRFVTRHHYAGTYPAGRLAFALTTDDATLATDGTLVDGRHLVGVAVLSVPMRADVLTNVFPDLDPYAQSLELGRFVLTDTPANAESWMLGRVFDLAADAGVRGLVSFADPMPRRREVLDANPDGTVSARVETITPGHVGLIYQATNGIPLGRSTARTLTYLPRHGIVLSDRMLSKVRAQESGAEGAERTLVGLGARARRAGEDPRTWLRTVLADLGAAKVRHPGNYRYAWTLGSRADRRRNPPALPRTTYPKPDRGGRIAAPGMDTQLTLA